ncbi:MAG: adenylate/guanylate cyclase domain-containing protein [Deltaproteobacteria bacterium]|nr:adenylate/guanylate cyclase domain-containing protein [Deltaproteobacteria bacterium]
MSSPPIELTIFFADVAGSTRLYETLGDVVAHECIVESLGKISHFVKSNNGIVVEIIGDEIMAYFVHPKEAITCGCDIQQYFNESTTVHNHRIGVRIGFHKGRVELDKGHPFGDTVNVASRVASFAMEGQVVTTNETIADLPPILLSRCRPLNTIRVKGKSQSLNTSEVVWDQNDATLIFSALKETEKRPPIAEIEINYKGQKIVIRESNTPFLIGRGKDCSLVISSDVVSRAHAKIEARLGELVIVDHSTNGTYVTTDCGKRSYDGLDMRLHYTEWTMAGQGKISLGQPVSESDENTIKFKSEQRTQNISTSKTRQA